MGGSGAWDLGETFLSTGRQDLQHCDDGRLEGHGHHEGQEVGGHRETKEHDNLKVEEKQKIIIKG